MGGQCSHHCAIPASHGKQGINKSEENGKLRGSNPLSRLVQKRENLHFFGLSDAAQEAENASEVLCTFFKDKL
mgnify:CR=1 FL=1